MHPNQTRHYKMKWTPSDGRLACRAPPRDPVAGAAAPVLCSGPPPWTPGLPPFPARDVPAPPSPPPGHRLGSFRGGSRTGPSKSSLCPRFSGLLSKALHRTLPPLGPREANHSCGGSRTSGGIGVHRQDGRWRKASFSSVRCSAVVLQFAAKLPWRCEFGFVRGASNSSQDCVLSYYIL